MSQFDSLGKFSGLAQCQLTETGMQSVSMPGADIAPDDGAIDDTTREELAPLADCGHGPAYADCEGCDCALCFRCWIRHTTARAFGIECDA